LRNAKLANFAKLLKKIELLEKKGQLPDKKRIWTPRNEKSRELPAPPPSEPLFIN